MRRFNGSGNTLIALMAMTGFTTATVDRTNRSRASTDTGAVSSAALDAHTRSREQGPPYQMLVATISSGGIIYSNGTVAVIGVPLVGTMSNAQYTMTVGSLPALLGLTVDGVGKPRQAPYPHDRRKNRYISFDPNKTENDGTNVAFKVELLSINQGSCGDGTGAQGGNVDFCRIDRGAGDCKACSGSGDSCISASIDCPPGESCDPTGAVCVNDLPNSGGANVGMIWWVGPEKNTATDPSLNIHLLVSEPFRKVSDNWSNPVHAGDCEVVPQASYGVRAVDVDSGAESDELVVSTTALNVCSGSGDLCNVDSDCPGGETCDPVGSPAPFWWGDVVGVLAFHCNGDIREQTCDPNTSDGDCTGAGTPASCCTGVGTGFCDCPGGDPCARAWELPNGVTNVDDVTAALWTSAPAPPTTVAAEFTWVDVHGNDSFTSGSQNFDPPNNKINASDLQQIISGFGGFPYKFHDPADCPDVGAWP